MAAGAQPDLSWVAYGKWLVFGGALLALLAWRWLQKRTLDSINRRADELEDDEEQGTKFLCPRCGQLHDISEMEPTHRYPDVIFAMPEDEREDQVDADEDRCALRGEDDEPARFFLRVVIPFAVRETAGTYRWGAWVEVEEPTFEQVSELWSDDALPSHGPWPGMLANELAGYAGTLGLPGTLRFTHPDHVPEFTFNADVANEFAEQSRSGVSAHTVSEWQRRLTHGAEFDA